jgi:uncharacterized protein (DUF1778 family)
MTKPQSEELIQVHLTANQASLIAEAARIRQQTSADFALSTILAKAQEEVLDQTFFVLSEEEFEDLEKELSEPPVANPRLTSLLYSQPPWEH